MLRAVAWLAALLPLAVLAVLFALRAAYPYELEWQEGGMLAHVERVRAGEGLYVEPTLEFLPFPYPPLFVWCASVLSAVVGEGFLALRLVSIVASVALLGLLVRFGVREGGALGGWLGAGLFAASYRFCGAWLDVGRVDALFLALVVVAYGLARPAEEGDGLARPVLVGLAFVAAVLAKQSAFLVCVTLAAGWAFRSRRAGAVAFLTFAAVLLVVNFAFRAATDGRYTDWVFAQLASHDLVEARFAGFWLDLARHAGPLLLLALLAVRRASAVDGRTKGLCVGLIGVAWVTSVHVGAYDSAFLPAILALALLAGPEAGRRIASGGRPAGVALALVLAQVALFAYDPRAQVPSAEDEATGDRLVALLAAEEGEVLVPYHGYLAARAGKRGGAHAMAIIDLLQSDAHDDALTFVQELEAGLAAQRWSLIWLDDGSWAQDLPRLLENYEHVPAPLDGLPVERFRPVTGAPWRPVLAYRPRSAR